jgi:hypothetical protein
MKRGNKSMKGRQKKENVEEEKEGKEEYSE